MRILQILEGLAHMTGRREMDPGPWLSTLTVQSVNFADVYQRLWHVILDQHEVKPTVLVTGCAGYVATFLDNKNMERTLRKQQMFVCWWSSRKDLWFASLACPAASFSMIRCSKGCGAQTADRGLQGKFHSSDCNRIVWQNYVWMLQDIRTHFIEFVSAGKTVPDFCWPFTVSWRWRAPCAQ